MADIKMAVGDRLETQHFLSGRVKVVGFDIDMHNPGPAPAPIFNDMVTTMSYDVGELTATNFIVAKDAGVPLVGLPVFPNLFFPLTGVTVNKRAGISGPADLGGKRIGVPQGFASNPAAWLRGILTHHFDVLAEGITWVYGDADSLAGVPYPRSARIRSEQRTGLPELLEAGEIDALVVGGGGATLPDGIALLVEDAYPIFESYFANTNTFPINTMLVMKERSVAKYPGLAEAVVAAAAEAHPIYDAEETDDGMHQGLNVGKLRAMGLFPRPHGLDTHGDSVRMLVQYLYEQGLIKKLWTLDELFV